MAEQYLGNVAEVESLDNVSNLIVESTNNGIKKIPTETLKEGIYKDLPIDSALSDMSENAVKNKVIKSALDAKANSIISTSSGTVFHESDCAAVSPINIKLFGKSKQDTRVLRLTGRSVSSDTNFSNASKRNFDGNTIFIGITSDNYLEPLNISNYFISENSIKIRSANSGYGIGFDVEVFEGEEYLLSYNASGYSSGATFYDKDGNYMSYVVPILNENVVVPSGAKWMLVVFRPTMGVDAIYENITLTLLNDSIPNMKHKRDVEFLGESGSIVGNLSTNNLIDLAEQDINTNLSISIPVIVAEGSYILSVFDEYGITDGFKYGTSYSGNFIDEQGNIIVPQIQAGVDITNEQAKSIKAVRFYYAVGHYTGNGSKYNVQLERGKVKTTYGVCNNQPFTFQTPNGLRGIPLGQTIPDAIKNSPIHMSGVYWDGEQYQIADTENEDGKDVQRITTERLLADKVKIIDSLCNDESNLFYVFTSTYLASSTSKEFLCDITTYKNGLSIVNGSATHNGGLLNATALNLFYIRVRKDSGITTLDEFKEYLTNNEVYITLILPEPIITDTTEEEKAQLDTLIMNYPNTTIVNDAGAFQEVTYIADTKNYIAKIEKKHEEDIQILKNAILSLGGNV